MLNRVGRFVVPLVQFGTTDRDPVDDLLQVVQIIFQIFPVFLLILVFETI